MDSLTQAALGAGIAAVCVPAGHRRRALVAGALLGTLPDLDVLIDYGDAVSNFTSHRGFSHSLFVLPPAAIAIWLALRRRWAPVRESPAAWLAAILLALVTHPLLDAHTAYGTQLLWPMETTPVAWSTLFIIDPLFTLPILVAVIITAIWPRKSRARTVLATGLGLSLAYLAFGWAAKATVEGHAREALAAAGHGDARLFSTPAPFTTLLWRVVARTGDGYLEGFDSLLLDEGSMAFTAHSSGIADGPALKALPALERLRWFADGFISVRAEGQQLVVTDLRMGQEPKYVFRFAVARRASRGWEPISPLRLPTVVTREDVARVLERLR